MTKYVIVSEKPWNRDMGERLREKLNANLIVIERKEDFTLERLESIKPARIFFPHWSYIIPQEIHQIYECIVFHMTDLPYGRGGSPLQNLIVRGFNETKLSALKVINEMDAGDIYVKEDLSLAGTAQEVFVRADKIIESMIVKIITEDIHPTPQSGEVYTFKRRKPEQSNMESLNNIKEVFDHIRMLDADGYPHAFLETDSLRLEFTGAVFNSDNSIDANVRILKK